MQALQTNLVVAFGRCVQAVNVALIRGSHLAQKAHVRGWELTDVREDLV